MLRFESEILFELDGLFGNPYLGHMSSINVMQVHCCSNLNIVAHLLFPLCTFFFHNGQMFSNTSDTVFPSINYLHQKSSAWVHWENLQPKQNVINNQLT